ncbi:MAG TPA: VOC family protein [Magnetospirillaceae bacterium]|jgi:catechol 2,3-dioxygenase-like lactoylglutathione lyase family enzyme
MIDHVTLRTKNLDVLSTFYEAILAPLGGRKLYTYDGAAAGFGRGDVANLWLSASAEAPSSVHVALAGATRAEVDAFYKAAIAAGARDNGKPGLRPDYHAHYYGAFVIDPDGNNIEAVCHKG